MKNASSSDSFYKVIADEAMMAILIMAPGGKCIYANQLAHDLLEFPLHFDTSQFCVEKLFPPESNDLRMRRLTSETLELQGLIQEIIVQKYSARTFVATLGIKHLIIDNVTHALLMIQDVTLQKKLQREITEKQSAINQAYQELILQNKQLKELDMAKNRFIAVTTHELRTPLSAIVASSEILTLKLYDTQQEQDEFIAMIHDQGQHLLNLVNDILDFSKIQSHKMDYFIEEKNIYQTVKNEVDALQTMAEASGIKLTLDTEEAPFQCYYDEVRIRQVLTNLINNAIKYNKKNGAVTINIYDKKEVVEVYIKDTGKGIAKDDLKKVFNEFETLGKVSHHAKGTGLGLPISQRMIQAMGGDIQLESEEGVGSTFWIQVPKKAILSSENYRKRPDSTGSGDLAA